MLKIPRNLVPKLSQFQQKHPELIGKYFLQKIKLAVLKNEKRTQLYRIGNTKNVAGVEHNEYAPMLELMKDQFVEAELYELAKESQELIHSIHINQLITETQKMKL